MNDAVYKFKRYEDSSLEYTGIDKHTGTVIGLWDTAIDTAVLAGHDRQSPVHDEIPDQVGHDEEPEPWERLQVGDTVIHKSLGPGEVMAIDDKYLIVKFPDRESKFHYPAAFEKGYLTPITI